MHLYYMLNKPRGIVTSRRDGRNAVIPDLLPPELRERLHPVGRLDKDTEGLLLLTDDGALDSFLLRPEHHLPKEYLFLCFGKIGEEEFVRMADGLPLEGSGYVTAPAEAGLLGYTDIQSCRDYLLPETREHFLKNPQRPVTAGRLRITEGHKHQVRLMVKAAGGHVFYLRRTAIGGLCLPSELRPGEFRELTARERKEYLGYETEET